MNKEMDKPGAAGGAGDHPYIWLRYATQFTAAGRTHTIEMGIPVPLGASAETRAQLIREAEAGMQQLTSHIEGRVNQVLQRNARPQGSTSAPTTAQASKPASKPPTAAPSPHTAPSQDVAFQPAQQIPQGPQGPAQEQGVVVPPTRTYVGSSMPTAPRLSADANGGLTLPQFLHLIKESMNLTSQQAKELLQVPTLNGLNLRDALERLQHIVGQKSGPVAGAAQKPREIGQVSSLHKPTSPPPPSPAPVRPPVIPIAQTRPDPAPIKPVPAPATPPAANLQDKPGVPIPIDLNRRGEVSDKRPGYRFDEEEDEDEEMEILFEGDDGERPDLSAEDRLKARDIISKLRGARGSSPANQARLTVLHNVAGSQISDEQLQQLLQGLWETKTEKKLKVDQVEALISWAKEDDFVSEVDAVLALLEEE